MKKFTARTRVPIAADISARWVRNQLIITLSSSLLADSKLRAGNRVSVGFDPASSRIWLMKTRGSGFTLTRHGTKCTVGIGENEGGQPRGLPKFKGRIDCQPSIKQGAIAFTLKQDEA
jgi:hypothetical protein